MNIVWAMEGVKRPVGPGRLLLLGALVYLLCRGLLLVQVLPHWQGADEPGHAEMAVLVARGGWPRAPDPGLQARIMADMRAARFFSWLDVAVPAGVLTGFAQVPRLADAPSQVGDESPLGYLPLALAAAVGESATPEGLLPRLRWAALVTALLWVLALHGAGLRLGGERSAMGLVAVAVFLPLGAVASATAGPDLVPALWVALWLGCLPPPGRPQRRGARWSALRLALVGLAALSKRSGLFLVPLALACEALPWRTAAGRSDRSDGWGWSLRRAGPVLPLLLAGVLATGVGMGRSTVAAGWLGEGRDWGAVRLAAAARSGGHGFRVTDGDPGAWQYLLRWVDLPSGRAASREVEIGAWLRVAAGHAPAAAQVVVTDGQGAWWGETVTAGADWSMVRLRFSLPGSVERLRVALVPGTGTAAGRGSFDIDDVILRIGDQELAINGGAEAPERWGAALARGLSRYLDAPRLFRGAVAVWRDPLAGLGSAARGLAFLLRSAWGGFGWLKVWPGSWAGALGIGLGLFMAAAALLAMLRPQALALGPQEGLWLRICGFGALAAVLVATAGPMLGAVDRLPQGRYLLPAYPFFALPGLALAERLWPLRGPWMLCLLLLSLDLWTLFGLMWPAFGGGA